MSQHDPKAPPTKTNASGSTPADPKSPPKAGASKGPASGGVPSFWYVILFLVVAAVFGGYWVQQRDEGKRPVVSAAADDDLVAETEVEGESASTDPALVITSDVRGADVYLNDNRVGKTPHKATPLSAGDYDVKVMHEGYETFAETVHVETPDDSVHATMRPISGGKELVEEEKAVPADIRGLGESVAVKHKHRIGSCEGVLRAGADGIRYETEHKDAFFAAYADIEELHLDGDELTLEVRDVRKYDFTEQNDNEEALVALYERAGAALAKTESADN